MYANCPVCNAGLCWDDDENAEDVGYSEPGIVTYCHCSHCGAEIEIFKPEKNPYKEEND